VWLLLKNTYVALKIIWERKSFNGQLWQVTFHVTTTFLAWLVHHARQMCMWAHSSRKRDHFCITSRSKVQYRTNVSRSIQATLRTNILSNSRFRNYPNNSRNINNLRWIIYPIRKGAANSKRMIVSFIIIWSHKTVMLAPHFSTDLLDLQTIMLAIDFGLFVRFISWEITQATSSLVSQLEIRFSILKFLETRLETMVMTRIESRDARIEMQRDCQLTFDRYCIKQETMCLLT